jgi:hypothetical protein
MIFTAIISLALQTSDIRGPLRAFVRHHGNKVITAGSLLRFKNTSNGQVPMALSLTANALFQAARQWDFERLLLFLLLPQLSAQGTCFGFEIIQFVRLPPNLIGLFDQKIRVMENRSDHTSF